jgi:hypothetical protein
MVKFSIVRINLTVVTLMTETCDVYVKRDMVCFAKNRLILLSERF